MKKSLYSLLVVLFFWTNIQAQKQINDYKLAPEKKGSNYYQIVKQYRQYFNSLRSKRSLTHQEKKAWKQFERWAYIWQDRVNADGSFPTMQQMISKDAYQNLLFGSTQKSQQDFSNNNWTQAGPVVNVNQNGYSAYPGMGRVNVVAVNPNNEQIMYAGAAAGGIWKTTNGGNSWTPIGDQFAGMGVTDIVIDPNNTNTIYVATGDEDGMHIPSIGVYKSTDGGANWAPTGLTFSLSNGAIIRDLAIAPNNSQKIFALLSNNIKYSTDGGANWLNANVNYSPYNPFTAYFQTIVFDPNDSNKVVVSDYYGGLYVSTNNGNSFALHAGIPGGNNRNILKLTTTIDDTDYFYGLDDNGVFKKFRFNMNNTASDMVASTNINGFNSQYAYNVCIAVSPTNKNIIFVGGVRGYVSTNNGNSFSVKLNPYNDPPGVGFYVHPDHHHLSFLSNGTTVIDGHDGGIHKGNYNANAWNDISNGLVITQSYNIGITQAQNGDDFMMANQDNDGFSKVLKNGTRQWVAAMAGDGTCTDIDYTNPNVRYLGGVGGALYKTTNGYSSSAYAAVSILSPSYSAAFVSPVKIHPTQHNTIYAGNGDVKKSTNQGSNFVSLNSGLSAVKFIEVVPNNGNTTLYAIGTNNAKKSTNNGSAWSNVTQPVGSAKINSFSAVPNSNTVYATVSGYINGAKVYKSTNGGASWTNISNGLPNIVMKKVVYRTDTNNETLFVGTELGVYWKNNTMTSWQKLGNGLPNVIVNDLRINYADKKLYIGTFGRGMWKISIDDSQGITFNEEEKPVVYPNPVTDKIIHIKLTGDLLQKGQVSYKIFNYVGGIYSEGNLTQKHNNIQLPDLATGLYFIRISQSDKSMVQKLIVK